MKDKDRNVRDGRPGNNTEYDFHSNDCSKKPKDSHMQWPEYFELDGKRYNNEGILSDSSKDAIIFTVTHDGRKYALKIYQYDPDHRPDHDILEKIHLLRDSGLLVPVISHGQLETPNFPGRRNDYQLMAFCEGGCLEDVFIKGDKKELPEVAVKIGAAIDFLSRRGLKSMDIRPANFYYLDRERTRIVLSGFGWSGKCHPGVYANIDRLHSIYNAPEFHTKVPGESPEVRVESHYFSLGMSLLSLWMGKDWFKSNERQLFRSKLNETLPMPKDMPEHIQSLIKSLTRLKLSDRADFYDIKRWKKGEGLGSDTLLPIHSDFHIDFNSTKSQLAHSPAAPSRYLLDDEAPGNMDYVTPGGFHLTELKDIARYTYENIEEMKDEFFGIDSSLKVFFKAHNLEDTLKQSADVYINRPNNAREDAYAYIAIFYFAEMFHDLPLPVYLHDHFEYAKTIDDLIRLIRTEGYISDINKAMIQSPGFILWLSFRNPLLADKIRKLIDSDTDDVESIYFNSSSAYRILFELDPNMDFKFNNDENSPDRVFTVSEIGRELESILIGNQTAQRDAASLIGILTDLDNTPYGDYLRARGESYFNLLAWNRKCLDVDDKDNKSKAGPYDIVIGIYKSVSGFLEHAPRYSLLGKLIDSPDELKGFPAPVVTKSLGGKDRILSSLDGMPLPWLAAWLTVFFQENPRFKLHQKSTYESETVKYTEFIASIDPEYYYAERYQKAENLINKSGTAFEKWIRRIKNRKTIFCVLAGAPTVTLMALSCVFTRTDYYLLDLHRWLIFLPFLPCFLAVGINKIIKDDGHSSTNSYIWGWIGRLLYAFALGCFIFIGSGLFPSTLTLAGIVALVLLAIKYGYKILSVKNIADLQGRLTSPDMSEFRYMEALYFAYKDNEKNADRALEKYFHAQIPLYEDVIRKINRYGWLWLTDVLFICSLWLMFHPRFQP